MQSRSRPFRIAFVVLAGVVIVEGIWIHRLLRTNALLSAQLPAGSPTQPAQVRGDMTTPVANQLPDAPPRTGIASERPASIAGPAALVDRNIRAFSRDGKLGDDFARLAEISDAERRQLDDLFAAVRTRLDASIASNASLMITPGGQILVEVEPFAEEGGKAYDEFFAALAEIMGTERRASFIGLAERQIESEFDHFGAITRTISIERRQAPDGSWGIGVSDDRLLAYGHGVRGGYFRDFASFAARYGGIVSILPDDVQNRLKGDARE